MFLKPFLPIQSIWEKNCKIKIAQRLKGEVLKGTIVPTSEDEIPKLIYRDLVGGESQS